MQGIQKGKAKKQKQKTKRKKNKINKNQNKKKNQKNKLEKGREVFWFVFFFKYGIFFNVVDATLDDS